MTTMLERAAKAACEARGVIPDAVFASNDDGTDVAIPAWRQLDNLRLTRRILLAALDGPQMLELIRSAILSEPTINAELQALAVQRAIIAAANTHGAPTP